MRSVVIFLKWWIAGVIAITLLVTIVFGAWFLSYEITDPYNCGVSPVDSDDLQAKIDDFNESSAPVTTLFLSESELKYLLTEALGGDNCVRLAEDNLQLTRYLAPLTFTATIESRRTAPFLYVRRVRVNRIVFPAGVREQYNNALRRSWGDFFDSHFSGKRISRLEIQESGLLIEGELP